MGFRLLWTGRGFGEPLILSLVTSILNDNGIDAVVDEHPEVKGLMDCKLYDSGNEVHRLYQKDTWKYERINVPIIIQYLKHFEGRSGKSIPLTRDHVPVMYHDIPSIPVVDVVMCTQTGNWTPYRQWPYFDELKGLFKKDNITYLDLNEEGVFSIELLNYVRRCKLYLGLDTGTSHYVSQFANNKALIIQGGYVTFDFVYRAYRYDYIKIEHMPCSPCFINKNHIKKNEGCKFNHKCMVDLLPEMVFEEVRKRIR